MMEQSYQLKPLHDQSFPTEHCRTSDGGKLPTCLLSFCGAGAVLLVICVTRSHRLLCSVSTQIHLLCSANYLTLLEKSVT